MPIYIGKAVPAGARKGGLAFDYPAGPVLGDILTAVQDAQLEGVIGNKEEAVAWVRENFPA